MITEKMIEEVKNRLVGVYDPEAIYIFGSYAWGSPTEDSDLDLLVVVDHIEDTRHQAMVEGHRALGDMLMSKDILVYSKEEFELYSQNKAKLCYKVKQAGKKIYAKA